MCEPVSTIATVASAAAKVGETLAASAAQNKQHHAVTNAANAAAVDDQNALSSKSTETQIAADQELQDTREKGAYAESMARVAAMEGGVTGNSVSETQQNIVAGESRAVAGIDQNLSFEQQQIERDRAGVEARRQARINSAPPSNPFMTGLQIAGAGADLFGTLSGRKPPG